MQEALTIEQVAERLQVHKNTVMNLIKNKELKAKKVGRLWRIPMEYLDEYFGLLVDNTNSQKEKNM